MAPANNLLRRHYDNYGVSGDFFQEKEKTIHSSSFLISSPMAEKEERKQEQEQVGSSKREEANDSWLQLGIGSPSAGATSQISRSLELDLFTNNKQLRQPSTVASRSTTAAQSVPIFSPYGFGYRSQLGYWNNTSTALMNMGMGGSSSSSCSLPPSLPLPPSMPYYTNYRQFVGNSAMTSELTVISRPTRRQTGVWFLLQAAKNQGREPFLQQIPKSYLRIKDCRMTVRLLMKYLVNKLGLDNESEVEISCRGQLLHPYLTLQDVRDSIWCLREAAAFLSDSPADHVMTLQYGRSR